MTVGLPPSEQTGTPFGPDTGEPGTKQKKYRMSELSPGERNCGSVWPKFIAREIPAAETVDASGTGITQLLMTRALLRLLAGGWPKHLLPRSCERGKQHCCRNNNFDFQNKLPNFDAYFFTRLINFPINNTVFFRVRADLPISTGRNFPQLSATFVNA